MAVGEPAPVDPDAARRAADAILTRPEYQPQGRPLPARFIEWVIDRLRLPAPEVDPGGSAAPRTSPLATVVLVALVLLALYLLYRAVRAATASAWWTRRRRRSDADDEVDVDVEAGVGARDAGGWDAEAARLEAEGRWRDAILARYRGAVAQLTEGGWVVAAPGATAAEIDRQLDAELPAAADAFSGVTRMFQTVWYGGIEPTAADGATVRRQVEQVRAVAVAAAPSPRARRRAAGDAHDAEDHEPDADHEAEDGRW